MSQNEQPMEYTGFGLGMPSTQEKGGVFILVVFREGQMTASAHASERGAMEAALDYMQDETNEDEEQGTMEDSFYHAQRFITEEGGVMEIIPSPIYGS